MSGARLTVIVPTWNERETIGPLLAEIRAAVPEAAVIVVDDSSPDGTGDVVREFAARNEHISVLSRPYGSGLTAAFRDGIAAAGTEYVAWLDADGNHPPALLPAMLGQLERGEADVVAASRYRPGGRDTRTNRTAVLASRVVNTLAQWLLTRELTDYTTGYVAARREIVTELGLRGDYGEYCIDFLYRARTAGYRVRELPFVNPDRRAGVSKTATTLAGFLRRAPQYVRVIWRLRTMKQLR